MREEKKEDGLRPGNTKHPMQPLYLDKHGTVRFKANPIVRTLLDKGGLDMNALAMMEFTDEDRAHFAQLIGYSLGGFGELSYVSDEVYIEAQDLFRAAQRGEAIADPSPSSEVQNGNP